MKIRLSLLAISISILAIGFSPVTSFASRAERREAAISESARPRAVSGGEKFSLALPSDKAFAAIVTALQKADYDVSDTNRDTGLIATAITVEGGWKQTGTRTVVTVIADGDAASLVRVVVTEQKRYKALQTEPWEDPVANDAKTKAAAAALKAALGTAVKA